MRAETIQCVAFTTDDEAIAAERMTVAEQRLYLENRDFEVVRPFFRDGMKPAIAVVREIPNKVMRTYVMKGDDVIERCARAFKCGVVSVTDVRLADGTVYPTWSPEQRTADQIGMTDEELDKFAPAFWQEIGAVAWAHSFLAGKTRRLYPLPHTSVELWRAMPALPAGQTPSAQAVSSSGPSPNTASSASA